MCFGSKSKGQAPQPAAPAPAPPNPANVADNSNDTQMTAQRMAAANSTLTDPAGFGAELGTSTGTKAGGI